MALAKGTQVRVKTHTPQGPVLRRAWDESADTFRHLVAYTGADGEQHEGWFTEDQLQEIAE